MSARLVCCALLVACRGAGSAGPPASGARPGATAGAPGTASDPLGAERRVVTDTYHGVAVADPYQWLEADTPEVQAWSERQNQAARAYLDALPGLAALRAEYTALLKAPATSYRLGPTAGGRTFALRTSADQEQPTLVTFTDLAHPEAATLVLDPTAGGHPGRTIDWYEPSPDGKRVAVSISEAGTETGALHLLDARGTLLEPPIPNVQRGTAGGDAAWAPDGKSIYYTRYPLAGEPHADEPDFWLQLRHHKLGAPVADDRLELGDDLPRVAEIMIETDARGRVLGSVQKGDGGEFRHYLRATSGTWTRLDDWGDGIVYVGFGATPDLWVISRQDAPRGKVMRLAAKATSTATATVVIPEGADAIVTDYYSERGLTDAADRLFVRYQKGGPSEVRMFGRSGKPLPPLALPAVAAVSLPTAYRDGVLIQVSSYTEPRQVLRFDPKRGTLTPLTALAAPRLADLSGFEVRRELATSADGTQVPFNVVWAKGAPQDGSMPCLATGYGGFSINLEPHDVTALAPLLTRGVCFIEANLRGGAELGEAWHRAGMLTGKQHVFDDFAAVLSTVAARQYTRADRLAIIGGSNGGLLMGAILTQHPELVAAAIAQVGIFDMLRNERTQNGSFVVPELGSVTDPAQFRALHAYSPYHAALAQPRSYPPTLFTTGANDPRVAPWHSRKMVAAMRAAGATPHLRTSATSGHGIGTSASEAIELAAHGAAFVLAHVKR